MNITVAVLSGLGALLTVLGVAWKAIRNFARNADAWDLVKKQLVPNAGSSMIDRVGKIEQRQDSQDSKLATMGGQIDAIHEKLGLS